jgi:hypothetical protein
MLSLVLVAGFTVSAYAEERLSLSGEYRVRGWFTENLSDWNSNNDADSLSYFDQRFRLATKIQAAEGVSVHMRFDYGEEDWGNRETGAFSSPSHGRPTENAELQVDRLYLRLERDIANFIAGSYNGAFGLVSAFETQQKWLLLRLKPGPMFIDVGYIKIDEGSGRSDESAPLNTEDETAYGAQFVFNAENMSAGAWLGYREDLSQSAAAAVNDDNLLGIGLYATFNLGMIDLKGEFNYFDGEDKLQGAATGVDLVGQQLWLFANFKFGDAMSLPVSLLYAAGSATDPTETQVTEVVPAFGGFWPQTLSSIYNGDYDNVPSGVAFDPAGTGGGVLGLIAGFDVQINEPWLLNTQIGYLQVDDEIKTAGSGADSLSAFYWLSAGVQWNFLPATDIGAVLLYNQPDYNDVAQPDDAGWGLFTKLRVKF